MWIKWESENLFGLNITHTHWPSNAEMKNWKQSIEAICTSQLMRNMGKEIITILAEENADEEDED